LFATLPTARSSDHYQIRFLYDRLVLTAGNRKAYIVETLMVLTVAHIWEVERKHTTELGLRRYRLWGQYVKLINLVQAYVKRIILPIMNW